MCGQCTVMMCVRPEKGWWETQEKTKYKRMSKGYYRTYTYSIRAKIQMFNLPHNRQFLPLMMCSFDDFVCRSCVTSILDEPVELPCKNMICSSCCFDHLKNNINSFCCTRQNHPLTISSFGKPTPPPLADDTL